MLAVPRAPRYVGVARRMRLSFDRASSALRGAVANCGGINLRPSRFAGRLAEEAPTEDGLLGVLHSLILPNGVRKTTSRGRNASLIESLAGDGRLGAPRRRRVLEIGASAGLDALATVPVLERFGGVDRYVLGDVCPHVLYDRTRGLIFDEDGALLQVRIPGGFVSMHFAYNYAFQRWTELPAHVPPLLLRAADLRLDRARVERIPLVHPDIRLEETSLFELKRLDVFDRELGRALASATFDLVICMHLLVPRYFDVATIDRGVANLRSLLAPGGHLLVGANEAYRVVGEDGSCSSGDASNPRR